MKELLTEFLSSVMNEESEASKQAKRLKLVKKPGFGLYGPAGDENPATHKSVDGKLTPIGNTQPAAKTPQKPKTATALEKPKQAPAKPSTTKQLAVPQQPTTATTPTQTPSVKTGNSIPEPSPEAQALQIGGDPVEYRANDIVEGIFGSPATLKLGPSGEPAAIRQILDDKGQVVDVSTENGRQNAVEILSKRIQQFHDNGTIAQVCRIMADENLPRSAKTALNKWLGNLGEVCGLRDMLAAGIESYLLQDSSEKNDIVSVIECKENDGSIREIKLVGLSTKSSKGTKFGRIDANSLAYIVDTVAEKMVTLNYGRDGRQSSSFKAENVATALYAMQKAVFRTLTRGTIVKRGSGKRGIVKPKDMSSWDETLLDHAIKTQDSKEGGQRILWRARQVRPQDIDNLFFDQNSPDDKEDKNSPDYNELVKKLTKIMDGNEMAARQLVLVLAARMKGTIMKTNAEGKKFSLEDYYELFTDEIVQLIDKPYQEGHPLAGQPSKLVFDSDMMFAQFDEKQGYVGMKLVAGETMTARVEDKFSTTDADGKQTSFSDLSTRDKLTNGLSWKANPRGLVPDANPDQGYSDVQPRAVPGIKHLKKGDFLSIDNFVKQKCNSPQPDTNN